MPSVLVLTPDPAEAEALVRALTAWGVQQDNIRIGAVDAVAFPTLDILVATGGNGKAQYGIQAQYLIDRCEGLELLACVGAAGRLTDQTRIGDIVLGTATIEHDYKERFHPRPLPRHDADISVVSEFVRLVQSSAFPFRVHFGAIASGDEDIVDPARAAELREATGALCAAWEGSGGARAARMNGIGFIEVRGITDAADGDAAQGFRDNVGKVMSNAVELLLAWCASRRETRSRMRSARGSGYGMG